MLAEKNLEAKNLLDRGAGVNDEQVIGIGQLNVNDQLEPLIGAAANDNRVAPGNEEVAVLPPREPNACQKFCRAVVSILLLPCTLIAAYVEKCSRATEEMFEHKAFNCKFTSVLFDSVFALVSYVALIRSAFEIRSTAEHFPFGFKDEAETEPLEVN